MQILDIVHIYAGTAGSAGLYMDEIIRSLENNYKQTAFVNYYYYFDNGKKIFYRYTELGRTKIKNKQIRLFIRFIELTISLIQIFFYLLINKPKLINYNLTSDLLVEFLFIILVKKILKIKILITCHDVLPFQNKNKKLSKKINRKKSFFSIVDFLLIHNENSKTDLMEFYDIKDNIFMIPFPLMDMSKLSFKNEEDIDQNEAFTVLMFGHFRIEKGLDILINAWNDFFIKTAKKDIKIVIAGNFPNNYDKELDKIKDKNAIIIKSFIDDFQLYTLIKKSNVVVLPYTRGTNSGIPSSVYSLETLLISSDIHMFKNNKLILDKYFFTNGDYLSLSKKINEIYLLNDSERKKLIIENTNILINYRNDFNKQIIDKFHIFLP